MRIPKISNRTYAIIISVIVFAMAGVLYWMGREPMCTCGYIKLWHGIVISSENSQHIFDWYAFTHIIHGLGFYALISLVGSKLPFRTKLLLAVFLESSWEILENTDMVINRYRTATLSLDYYGDSIVNSISDVIAMVVGFYFAWKSKIWISIALFVAIEAILAIIIRDNLTLNIIMLIFPLDAIKSWQSAALQSSQSFLT